MFPDEEGKEETTDQETIRDIDFGIEDIKEAMGDLDETSGLVQMSFQLFS